LIELTDIDHVGIAVSDLDEAIATYERLLGVAPTHRERVEDQDVEEVLSPSARRPSNSWERSAPRRRSAGRSRSAGPACITSRTASMTWRPR